MDKQLSFTAGMVKDGRQIVNPSPLGRGLGITGG
jgi:hypothetical protein